MFGLTGKRLPFGDGKLLARNMADFLPRMNNGLRDAAALLPDFELEEIEVALEIDAGMNISFAGIGGNLDRNRTLTFTLKPKPQNFLLHRKEQ